MNIHPPPPTPPPPVDRIAKQAVAVLQGIKRCNCGKLTPVLHAGRAGNAVAFVVRTVHLANAAAVPTVVIAPEAARAFDKNVRGVGIVIALQIAVDRLLVDAELFRFGGTELATAVTPGLVLWEYGQMEK